MWNAGFLHVISGLMVLSLAEDLSSFGRLLVIMNIVIFIVRFDIPSTEKK